MNTTHSRRTFIKNSALLGALIAVDPFSLIYGRSAEITDTGTLVERILPVAIQWDAANLMIKDTTISWKMMDSISEQFNKMVSGRVLEKGKKHIPEILDIIKAGDGWDEETHSRVALFAGWLINREVADVITPLYKNDSDGVDALQRDATVLKYKIARENNDEVTTAHMEDLLMQMFHRATYRTHTLTPDKNDWDTWVINYLDWFHTDRASIRKLAQAWSDNTGAASDRQFFNPNDKLIQIANDYSIWEIELTPEFFDNKGDSLYTKALTNAAKAIKSLDDFFNDKLDKQVFMKKMNIV